MISLSINILIYILIAYITLIFSLILGFDKVLDFSLKENNKSVYNRNFTIIVVFRNEAKNLSALAKSLQQIDYPITQYEIIFVNDGSTDQSVAILNDFIDNHSHWKIIDNIRTSNSPKKDGITLAIQQAKYDWIITTDADCQVSKTWLQIYSDFTEHHPKTKLIAAPVKYKSNKNFLHEFQQIDFLSLIGTTIGSFGINKPFMCNGANLCYNKSAFIKVNGYQGNNTIASGDDVFLLEKINTVFPKQVNYLKSNQAVVVTQPVNSVKSLIKQRIRWASKTSASTNNFSKLLGIIVFIANLSFILSPYFLFILNSKSLIFLFLILGKLQGDYQLIKKTYQFLEVKFNFYTFVKSSLVYPFFVVYVVVLSFFTKVQWKG